eukprot:4682352-Amphidinium_carterae.1
MSNKSQHGHCWRLPTMQHCTVCRNSVPWQEVTAKAQKLVEENEASAATLSTAIDAASSSKSRDRTLPLTGKKNQKVTTKKKAKGSVVKLAATKATRRMT